MHHPSALGAPAPSLLVLPLAIETRGREEEGTEHQEVPHLDRWRESDESGTRSADLTVHYLTNCCIPPCSKLRYSLHLPDNADQKFEKGSSGWCISAFQAKFYGDGSFVETPISGSVLQLCSCRGGVPCVSNVYKGNACALGCFDGMNRSIRMFFKSPFSPTQRALR